MRLARGLIIPFGNGSYWCNSRCATAVVQQPSRRGSLPRHAGAHHAYARGALGLLSLSFTPLAFIPPPHLPPPFPPTLLLGGHRAQRTARARAKARVSPLTPTSPAPPSAESIRVTYAFISAASTVDPIPPPRSSAWLWWWSHPRRRPPRTPRLGAPSRRTQLLLYQLRDAGKRGAAPALLDANHDREEAE